MSDDIGANADPAPGAGNEPAPEAAPAWTDGMSEPSLRMINAKGIQSAAELGDHYVNLEKMIGQRSKDTLTRPAADAEPDTVREFWKELGAPGDPAGYELKAPEGIDGYDQKVGDAFAAAADKYNIPKDAARGLHDDMVRFMAEQNGDPEGERNARIEAANNELQQIYGEAFEERMGVAKRAVGALAGDEETAERILGKLEDTELGSDKDIIAMLVAAGSLMSEDRLGGEVARTVGGAMMPSEIQTEIDRITGKELTREQARDLPYWDQQHPAHAEAVQKVGKLMERLDPEGAEKPVQKSSFRAA